jgi:hypothetical protein
MIYHRGASDCIHRLHPLYRSIPPSMAFRYPVRKTWRAARDFFMAIPWYDCYILRVIVTLLRPIKTLVNKYRLRIGEGDAGEKCSWCCSWCCWVPSLPMVIWNGTNRDASRRGDKTWIRTCQSSIPSISKYPKHPKGSHIVCHFSWRLILFIAEVLNDTSVSRWYHTGHSIYTCCADLPPCKRCTRMHGEQMKGTQEQRQSVALVFSGNVS